MANTFISKTFQAVGTGVQSVYTVPSATTAIVFGLTLSNILAGVNINANITVTKSGGSSTNLVRLIPIPIGSTFSSDTKIALETGDNLSINSDTAASIDIIASILEIT